MPDSFLDALDSAQRTAWWAEVVVDPRVAVLVATDAGVVGGFCSLLVSRDGDASAGTGEIATLYVDPDRWRSGFGSALLTAAVDVARERGFGALSLWVLATNSAARAFYEAHGFSADGREKTDSRLGVSLHEVRYQRNV